MKIIQSILRDLKKEKVLRRYDKLNRRIDSGIYNQLKSQEKCSYCKKPFSGQIPEIHHIISIKNGGTNDISNLMSVHKKCHKELDEKTMMVKN